MHVIFQKMGKTGQKIWKFGQNGTKFKNILKKGRWFGAISARNILLVKALDMNFKWYLFSCNENIFNYKPQFSSFCNNSKFKISVIEVQVINQ